MSSWLHDQLLKTRVFMGRKKSSNLYIKHSDYYVLLIKNSKEAIYEVLIDIEDYEKVSSHNFAARKDKSHGLHVVMCPVVINNKKTYKRIHQIILGSKESMVIDHINGNRLDNRKANLRFVNSRFNAINRKTRCLRGVTWRKKDKIYVAQITHLGKLYYLGQSKNPQECAKLYLDKFKELNGYDHPKK